MREKIREILKKALEEPGAIDLTIPEAAFGHYSTNIALRYGKEKGGALAFAKELSERIQAAAPAGFFEKVEVQPPGFINFWLSPSTIQQGFQEVLVARPAYGRSSRGKGKTVIVEYSQPNIAKRMHVGHLRTTVLGEALANIYEALGYRVVRWNYLGDWGTQFGILIAAYKKWGNEEIVRSDPIGALERLYVKFHDEMKLHPELQAEGREEFRKLEAGDKENRKLWEWFKAESLQEFHRIYELLGVRFDREDGEQAFQGGVEPLVEKLMREGVAKESEGALVIPLQGGMPPALLQKSDGATLYLSRDIVSLEYRIKTYKPEKILYVVGNEQSLHFSQLFAVAERLGLTASLLVHVKYGLILGEEGRKLASREGRTIFLDEVVEKAVELARSVVRAKSPELDRGEQETIAKAVGIGALKYAILKEHRHSDIVFDWERMLDLRGASAPYLQYTYARLRSIIRKAEEGGELASRAAPDVGLLTLPQELALMRHLFEFGEVLQEAGETYLTNGLALYLYVLAEKASRFYENVPVLKEEEARRRMARLTLVGAVAAVLKKGLNILGIEAVERI